MRSDSARSGGIVRTGCVRDRRRRRPRSRQAAASVSATTWESGTGSGRGLPVAGTTVQERGGPSCPGGNVARRTGRSPGGAAIVRALAVTRAGRDTTLPATSDPGRKGLTARLLCAAAMLLAAACAAPSLFHSGPTLVHGPVDDMLDRRTQALRTGDEARFLADLDQKQPDLVQRERMLFANLRQFQFSEIRLHQFFPPDIAKPIDLHEGRAVEVGVLLSYRLAGIDTGGTQDGFDY